VLKSVQNLIRGKHQCLVAEIRFGDPIPPGATPAANENLSQRNLAIVESDNPGPEDAHTIAHTFELRTTLRKSEREFVNTDGHLQRFNLRPIESAFDELMIVWGGVPEDAEATLYLPALRADDIIAAASLRYGPPRIEKVDERTIRCRIGDITYVPLPAIGPTQVAGLLTIVLPQTVKTGQNFRVILRQHSRAQGRIAGLRSGDPRARGERASSLGGPAAGGLQVHRCLDPAQQHLVPGVPALPGHDRWTGARLGRQP
jgi:hypothetical protein